MMPRAVLNVPFGDYLITTDKALMQPAVIHQWLAEESHWAQHIPFDVVQASIENSFCIGALYEGRQVAFAKLVTDYATFAYLADVYVIKEHRGEGVSKEMMRVLMDLEWVKSLRRMMLATKDAHGLYEQFGFRVTTVPERIMEILRPADKLYR